MQLLPTVRGESFSDDAAAANYSVHGMTGVEKLHQAGVFGDGATVAIVDSGVQYTHPALGGGIGPNFTVVGGYDLVGKDWPDVPAQPDNDPMDEYGHGTHVAGIIAGNSDQFIGVSPAAKLLSFKVFGDSGYSNEETVIQGFLMAFDSGADIISASLGEGSGFTTNALAVVASRMVDQGVVVVIAAGNSGQDGPFMASNGASGKSVITVAAAEPGEFPAQTFAADFILDGLSNKTDIAYISGSSPFPTTIVDWPIYPLTMNSSVQGDACGALPAATSDLSNVIVLVRMGGCSMSVKQGNLVPFNASYILFYNDDGPFQNPVTSARSGVVGAIEARAGEAIVNTYLAGGNVTATFKANADHYVGLYNAGGGRPALYTSWGGTYDLALKPDIAAPGTKILNYGFWAPTTQVGAGLVDAEKALTYDTEISFVGRKFELNDTANFVRTQSVEITNQAGEAVTYTFSLQDAGGYESYIPAVPDHPQTFVPEIKLYGDVKPVKMVPEVAMPQGDFIVSPGETKTANFTFALPPGLNASTLPVYTGKILISGTNGEELGIPYFGVGSDIRHDISNIWDYGGNFPYLVSTAQDIRLAQKAK
ncbi:putative minor extracellular protease vpr protein [Phaeoacremonium minimum UCRPA7]|uniref:Putative minor extracellular protease vpr protein n=1 Tax=Phaeoacremonium minimum (strain UCR-PA7) TaxID=1286976 RepID=R8BPH3_PHAM7|nr:putative minor extracellular protease vpr protein [Phaeoacremonium minimum UCRPA7]EOO01237.1 putative minor extracellular protease vpr protein [Phaeoacremonium minimum UCRPA7]